MAKELTIYECEDVLVVTAKQGRSVASGLIGAIAADGFVAIALRSWLGVPVLATVVALVAGMSLLLGMRPQGCELQVTSRNFRSRGRFGDSFRSTRSVNSADVLWLEYQEDTTGPETAHHPGGLYAVLKYRSICILPYVDQQQAGAVIERIAEKFPDLSSSGKVIPPSGNTLRLLALASRSRVRA